MNNIAQTVQLADIVKIANLLLQILGIIDGA